MNCRWEIHEDRWLRDFRGQDLPVDYVVLNLDREGARDWLEESRERVELIGRCPGPATPAALDRALELDVDFFCAAPDTPALDARRLPLRLVVDQDLGPGHAVPELLGAAWARRLHGWSESDADQLTALARRERIFLAGAGALPSREFLRQVEPFACAIGDLVTATQFRDFLAG